MWKIRHYVEEFLERALVVMAVSVVVVIVTVLALLPFLFYGTILYLAWILVHAIVKALGG